MTEESRYRVRTKHTGTKLKREDSPEKQEAASSSKGPATYEEPEETGLLLDCQGAGEEYEQDLVWQGLDEND